MRKRFQVLALAVAPLPILATAFTGSAQAADPQVALTDNVSPAVAHSQRVGDLPAAQQVSVAVALKLHNTAQLDRFVADVANPRSPMYGKYLTPQQFAAQYGATKSETDRVTAFLRDKGLTINSVSGQVVDATGTSAQLAGAFSTSMGLYDDAAQHRQFFANDRAPLVPAAIAGVVQGVSGLDNFAVRHHSAVSAPKANPNVSGLGPDALRSIYNTNPIGADGSGQTVALYEFDGYKQSDIAAYDKNYNLGSSAPVTVPVNGQNYDSNPGGGEAEVDLDIEIVQAMAPKASTLVYEAANDDNGELNMVNQIVKENKAPVVSISWGICEKDISSSQMTSVDNGYKQGAAQGQSFFVATGDDGSKGCARSQSGSGVVAAGWPGTSPNVTGVGGTTLTVGSNNSYGSERGWSGSGGGTSIQFNAPTWQTGVNGKRTEPDVALDADPQTGYAVYTGGKWAQYGGTSCAAPMWAGWAALYNQKAKAKLGNPDAAIYGIGKGSNYGSAFHDVTSGSNGDFSAKTGYDQVTGWGSYNGNGLYTALNGTPTGNTVSVTNPGDQTNKVSEAVNLQVKATDSAPSAKLTYSASGLPAGLSIDSGSGLITGTTTTQAVSNVTVTATDETNASGNTGFKWTVGTPPTGTVTVTNPGSQWGFRNFALFQTIQLSATASDGGSVTFSATGLPPGLSISASGAITGTPSTGGNYSVTATATEANGAHGSATFAFQIYG
ncbi:protease pro-enzyme activation domain-containing protein [Amycolatopsis sp. H20-H5]|uniref:protease pro-enzyme activation domain-containing protein n=1 Tax=Amycolatopsis sp. H20-H5 TaxID=3046309 RepID=UPI002DBC2BC7|nr:protease pro-enzyme activation domain-containing protein [Amycolatopsis sp. H20-H5]MEC3976429.1 protease pro-enzyme activation domain-containing protein [Amycolatopsis sp. H20-H5]